MGFLDDPYTKCLEVTHLEDASFKSISCLEFSPSGRYLLVGGDGGELRVLETSTGALVYSTSVEDGVVTALWHPSAKRDFFFGTNKGAFLVRKFEVYSFSLPQSQEGHPIFSGLKGQVYALAFDATQELLAVGISEEIHITKRLANWYSTAVILSSPQAERPHAPVLIDDRIRAKSLHFSRKGRQLIVSYLAHGIICWDTKTGDSIWRIVPAHASQLIGYTALSPDRRYILLSNLTDGMDLYEISKPYIIRSFRHGGAGQDNNFPLMPRFLHGGSSVTGGTLDGEVKIWKTTTGECVGTLQHECELYHYHSITPLA
ncbi:WD40 repeat-like protein [Dentipellis sp. KUC8613]|nr:WD40 repeat-like protein [Dentipellis sp. KUC8613]